MSKYSDASLELLLDNYFLLFEGILPNGGAGRSTFDHSSFESASLLKADLDNALCILTTDCRWKDVLEEMNTYFRNGYDPQSVFSDDKKWFKILSRYQKAIVRSHFNIEGFIDEDEKRTARQARKQMLRYLNDRVTPTEYKLVSTIVKCLLTSPEGLQRA
uniref:Uncharacterized protein n=1 Tax=viral metagenome TaxID=1070528 RepID=A0A6M3LGF4_9ZZZZ